MAAGRFAFGALMPITRTTRKGNGLGHGGEAKGAGKGDGWGGPATGAPKRTFNEATALLAVAKRDDAAEKALREQRLAAIDDMVFTIAMQAEREETKLSACVAYQTRKLGAPIARTVTATVTDPNAMTDAELAAIAAGGRTASDAAADDSPKPSRVVN
jgi:hypothetical protein